MAGLNYEKRHGDVIDVLKLERSKSAWKNDEIPDSDEWWRLKNSVYLYGNLSRHMVNSGRREELANLLCDVRWTLRRFEIGGWLAMKMDFQRLFAGSDHAEVQGIRLVYKILQRRWSVISRQGHLLAYYVEGSLTREEQKNKYTALYIESMMRYLPRPFLVPRLKFLGLQDNREVSHMACHMKTHIWDMNFSSSADKVVVGGGDRISVWSVSAQKELRSFSLLTVFPEKSLLRCVAISANGKLIVSGHANGTFMVWDGESGEPVGPRVEAHSKGVTCLAISKVGSTIVTGSEDETLRLWNAKSGEPKGTPMKHAKWVTCVVICDSGSMVVSGSLDGTVCRWNMETGAMIGEPLLGHKFGVTCVSVDENGRMIVSGSVEKTLIRWDAEAGKQMGKPMFDHSEVINCVSISP